MRAAPAVRTGALDVVRAAYEAFAEGDMRALARLYHPEIALTATGNWIGHGSFHGAEPSWTGSRRFAPGSDPAYVS